MDSSVGHVVRRLQEGRDDPELITLDDDAANQIFDALTAEKSRDGLSACYDEPRTVIDLADELDTSIQNPSYHLNRLEAAELLEPGETQYGYLRR